MSKSPTQRIIQEAIKTRYIRISVLLLLLFVVIADGPDRSAGVLEIRLVSQAILLIAVGPWLALVLFRRGFLPRTPMDLPLVSLCVVAAVSAAFALNSRLSLEILPVILLQILLFYWFLILLKCGLQPSFLMNDLLVTSALVSFIVLAGFLFWSARVLPLSSDMSGGWSFDGTLYLRRFNEFRTWLIANPNHVAAFLNLILPLAVVRFVASRLRWAKVSLAVLLVCMLLALLLTKSRTGLIGISVSAIVLFGLLAKESMLGRVGSKLGAIAALGISVVILLIGGYYLFGLPATSASASFRITLWQHALDLFRQQFLTGVGPGLLGFSLLAQFQADTSLMLVSLAHNTLINNAAEYGIGGIIVTLWLFLITGKVAVGAYVDSSTNHQRLLAIGYLSSLAGFAAENMTDSYSGFLIVMLPLIAVSALAVDHYLSLHPGEQSSRNMLFNRFELPASVFPLLAIPAAVFSLYVGIGQYYFDNAMQSARNSDWQGALASMTQAVQWDPAQPYYRFQLGFIYGQLAAKESSSERQSDLLDRGIEEYEKGLRWEPNYAMNRANVATLLWSRGHKQEALQEMKTAISLSPNYTLYYLNLGSFYEELNQTSEALSSYDRALALDPELFESPFWRQSPFRQSAFRQLTRNREEDFGDGKLALLANEAAMARVLFEKQLSSTPGSFAAHVYLGQLDLDDGEINHAHDHFSTAVQIDGQNPLGFAWRAITLSKLGQYDAAIGDARRALLLSQYPSQTTMAHYAVARVERAHGRKEEAAKEYALSTMLPLTFNATYGPVIYKRGQPLVPFLPQFILTGPFDALIPRYREWALTLVELGDDEGAREVLAEMERVVNLSQGEGEPQAIASR